MAEIHRMMPLMAGYTAVTYQHDPKGAYLCGSCKMRLGPGPRGGCTAVLPGTGESDGAHIDFVKGGCNLYANGPAASLANQNPNRLSKEDAGYVEDGPFSCRRCGNFLGGGHLGCVRVMGGKQGVRAIEAGECCDGWQTLEAVPEHVRTGMSRLTRRVRPPARRAGAAGAGRPAAARRLSEVVRA